MNEQINVLIVEDDEEIRFELKSYIQLHPKFNLYGETGSENEGLELLKKKKVDVVILDLELYEGNGISFAEQMRKLSIQQPFVVVTTNNCSDSIQQYLRYELKIDFIFQKSNTGHTPEQILNIIEKVYKFHGSSNPKLADEKEIIKKRIRKELFNIGFTTSYIGTEYLIAALLTISDNPDTALSVSKVLYPKIAKQYNTQSTNVEKAIRIAIERTWKNANLMSLTKYYPYEVVNKNARPSNKEFIKNMSLRLFGT